MLFNSLEYIGFLFIVYGAHWLLPHRPQNLLLLAASYFFYALWDVRFVVLLGFATTLTYCVGLSMRPEGMTKRERSTTSIWVLLIGFIVVVIPWVKHPGALDIRSLFKTWDETVSFDSRWWFFGTVSALTAAGSIFHSKLNDIPLERRKKAFLMAGIIGNLSVLCIFKYYNFFIDTLVRVLSALGVETTGHYLNIFLLVGISFYTFKCISYCMDVYRGTTEPERNFVNFALYVAFFPSLLAGPIDRAGNLLPQLATPRRISWDTVSEGLHLIFNGLFKKIVIADGVVRTVSSVYESTGQVSWIDVATATLLFTIQIYCDFSGYTDMARGSAKLFGLDLMVNFKSPYFSKNPKEFWSRWHITLSTWLRDYLYIPLGGNRHGNRETYRNLTLTMVLGGLWHGAAWNYVLWGLYHGFILSVHRAALSIRSAVSSSGSVMRGIAFRLACFLAICYGWLLFRSPSLERTMSLTSTLVMDIGNMDFGAMKPKAAAFFGLPILLTIEAIEYANNGMPIRKALPLPVWTAFYAAMIFCIIIGMSTESAQFIYFKF